MRYKSAGGSLRDRRQEANKVLRTSAAYMAFSCICVDARMKEKRMDRLQAQTPVVARPAKRIVELNGIESLWM